MAALKLPRRAYVPGNRPVRVRQYDDVPATVVTYNDDHGRPYAVAWRGKAQKPALNYRYQSAEHREQRIRDWLEGQRANKASREQARAAKNAPHSLRVGQVLSCSWGYDQTNVDWYEVTRIIGKRYVEIREIGAVAVGEQGGPQERVAPHVGHYIGEPMKKAASADNSIRMTSYSWAHLWNGEPKAQTGFGWGH